MSCHPKVSTKNTGTAQIFRLPEVKAIVKGDFIVLPCDLVCEFWWRILAGNLDDQGSWPWRCRWRPSAWSETCASWWEADSESALASGMKRRAKTLSRVEETDFIGTSPLNTGSVPPSRTSLLSHMFKTGLLSANGHPQRHH